MTTDLEIARREWQQWRKERNSALKEPHGWLSLIDLERLGSEPAPLRYFPGQWTADGHHVVVTFVENDGVTVDDECVIGAHEMSIPDGGNDMSLMAPDGRIAEVASRSGSICVRTRDPQAPTRIGFVSTDCFDYDAGWVVSGPFRPDALPWKMRVASAQPGGIVHLTVIGQAEILGQTVLVTGEPDSLDLIFHDASNGTTTEEWRHAAVEVDPETRVATVDFNRASNFPASFTPYGTCPTPPASNRFDIAITAGEKKNQ